MHFFSIFDKRNGSMSLIQALNDNAARRNLKKVMGWNRIPKRVVVSQMPQQDVETMINAAQAQTQVQEGVAEVAEQVAEVAKQVEGVASELDACPTPA
jgi:hypothetical protein